MKGQQASEGHDVDASVLFYQFLLNKDIGCLGYGLNTFSNFTIHRSVCIIH